MLLEERIVAQAVKIFEFTSETRNFIRLTASVVRVQSKINSVHNHLRVESKGF
jgi:hypothetical protein